jgi:hypothetical protein
MDLGCLDLGCISVLDKHSSDSFVLDPVNKECDSREKVSSGSKIGKVNPFRFYCFSRFRVLGFSC